MFQYKNCPNIKALVLDFDGVIADTEGIQNAAWCEVARRREIDPCDLALGNTPGMSDYDIAKILHSRTSDSLDILISEKEELTQAHLIGEGMRPIKGIKEFITWACSRFSLAVASSSSKSYLTHALLSLSLLEYFSVVVSSDHLPLKPDPAVYVAATGMLKVKPRDCLAIEDSPTGLRSAKCAGLFTVGISGTFSYSDLCHVADLVVDSFVELRCFLESIAFSTNYQSVSSDGDEIIKG